MSDTSTGELCYLCAEFKPKLVCRETKTGRHGRKGSAGGTTEAARENVLRGGFVGGGGGQ